MSELKLVFASDKVAVNNVVICLVDEYRQGKKEAFDAHVQRVQDNGIDVIYLSGHRSRNDFVPWVDVLAKVDKRKPRIKLKNTPFSGHFEVFDKPLTVQEGEKV